MEHDNKNEIENKMDRQEKKRKERVSCCMIER